MEGLFVSFDSQDLAGKSQQARLLVEYLRGLGISVIQTREPGGTPEAELLRSLLLSHENNWSAQEEALLFAAARANHVRTLIKPALEAGKWVICDRYLDSSLAYQAYAGALEPEDVLALHKFGSDGLLPDITISLEISAEERHARLASRGLGEDRMEAKDHEFHDAVRAGYAKLADLYPDRIRRVDGHGTVEQVAARIQALLGERISLHLAARNTALPVEN